MTIESEEHCLSWRPDHWHSLLICLLKPFVCLRPRYSQFSLIGVKSELTCAKNYNLWISRSRSQSRWLYAALGSRCLLNRATLPPDSKTDSCRRSHFPKTDLKEYPIRHFSSVPDGYDSCPGTLHVFDVRSCDVGGATGDRVVRKVFLRQHTLGGTEDRQTWNREEEEEMSLLSSSPPTATEKWCTVSWTVMPTLVTRCH